VEIRGFGFPYELHVAAGSTVTWINRDAVPHDVVAFDGSWSSALFNEGESYSHTFTAAGRQPYKCTIHPYMQAIVVVD
jgi:plastocyanin